MVFKLIELESAGLLAKVEAEHPWDAFNILVDLLAAFYAKNNAVMEEKGYEQFVLSGDKKKWVFNVARQGSPPGRVELIYLGDFPRHKLYRHWTEHKFWIFFKFSRPGISEEHRDRFKRFV